MEPQFEASVFYWGDGLNIQAHMNESVIKFLTKLSSQLKEGVE